MSLLNYGFTKTKIPSSNSSHQKSCCNTTSGDAQVLVIEDEGPPQKISSHETNVIVKISMDQSQGSKTPDQKSANSSRAPEKSSAKTIHEMECDNPFEEAATAPEKEKSIDDATEKSFASPEKKQKTGGTSEKKKSGGSAEMKLKSSDTSENLKSSTTLEKKQKSGTPEKQKSGGAPEKRQKCSGSPEKKQKFGGTTVTKQKSSTPEKQKSSGTPEKQKSGGTPEKKQKSSVSPEKQKSSGTPEKKQKSGGTSEMKKSGSTPDKKKSGSTPQKKQKSSEFPEKEDEKNKFANNSLSETNGTAKKVTSKSPVTSAGFKGDSIIPHQKVKLIMKSYPGIAQVSQEAVNIMTKASELFLQEFARQALCKAVNQKLVDYDAVAELVCSDKKLSFLGDTIPKKITWAECQKILEDRNNDTDDMF